MTIKDIARESGYAVGTVSRALNNAPGVSAETRQKILEIVNRHNYEPNANAKHLKQQTNDGIALIVKGTQNMLFAGILEPLQQIIEEKFRQLAMYLLGRILVVENLDKAVQLAKKYRHQYKLVTLEGDILNPGGAMTGGSQQKKALHVFGRSREIRSLQEALQTANRTITEMRDRLALANEDLQEIEQETVEKKMELQRPLVLQ